MGWWHWRDTTVSQCSLFGVLSRMIAIPKRNIALVFYMPLVNVWTRISPPLRA